MTLVLVALAVLAATVAAAASTGGLRLRRYSAGRVDAQLTIGGRLVTARAGYGAVDEIRHTAASA